MEALGEASSHIFEKAGGGSFGGTEQTFVRNPASGNCEAADPVLKGLGGASQEDQQPALVFKAGYFKRGL